MRTSFAGKRDKRGDWRPRVPLHLAPLFDWPTQPMAIVKWLFGYPGYFLPWGVIYMAFPVVTWLWFTPAMRSTSRSEMRLPQAEFWRIRLPALQRRRLLVIFVISIGRTPE